jgi:uncharacterized protein YutE (UPF0331/DUF86 family)
MTIDTESGKKLQDIIKKAIEDLEITTSEYEQIMAQAGEDGVIDHEEQELLKQLTEMISNGTLKRVPG